MDMYSFTQRHALEDMDRQLAANRREQNVMLIAVMALRRRRRQREERRNRRAPRRWWVKPWVRDRQIHSQYANLFQQLDQEFDMDYRSYVRLDRNTFNEVLTRIAPRITKSPR